MGEGCSGSEAAVKVCSAVVIGVGGQWGSLLYVIHRREKTTAHSRKSRVAKASVAVSMMSLTMSQEERLATTDVQEVKSGKMGELYPTTKYPGIQVVPGNWAVSAPVRRSRPNTCFGTRPRAESKIEEYAAEDEMGMNLHWVADCEA